MSNDNWLIRVPDIAVNTYIGVYDWEHERPQSLNVSLEMVPAESPSATCYVDYAAVVAEVREFANRQPRTLLEEFAAGLSDDLWQDFELSRLRVGVTKTIDIGGQVSPSVTLERARHGA